MCFVEQFLCANDTFTIQWQFKLGFVSTKVTAIQADFQIKLSRWNTHWKFSSIVLKLGWWDCYLKCQQLNHP